MAENTEKNIEKAEEKNLSQAKKPEKKKKGSMERMSKYFREVKSEIKKIVWPDKKQVANNTGVVLVTILLVGVVIWTLDIIFGTGRELLFNLFA